MTRPWLTSGNLELLANYVESLNAHFDEPVRTVDQNIRDRVNQARQELLAGSARLNGYKDSEVTQVIPPRKPLIDSKGNSADQTSFMEPKPWTQAVAEDMAVTLGRGGSGAIVSIAEALLVVNSLGHIHGTDKIYYRGEHKYGYELKSRAQRILDAENGGKIESTNGITDREIEELRRFQDQVKADPNLISEASFRNILPEDNSPEWLPIMQHYDEKFGTRLLDITSSVFSGIHFACIDWNGNIDFDTDGILYVFLGHGRYYQTQPTGTLNDEISEFVPDHVEDSFKGWRCPDYLHHYASTQSSLREIAQDGHFFVQSDLSLPFTIGAKGQFKICIPHWAKPRLIQELWFAGFTPEKMVRGPKGMTAAKIAESQLKRHGNNWRW